jgi:hypothetical protein
MLHYIEGPCNIRANNLSRLNCLVTPAQIAEGKKPVEPTEVFDKEKTKQISWIKNTLVFPTMRFKNVLSVISTYLRPHIRIKLH